MATCRRSWSDIPSELAGLVLLRLPAHSDGIRFAAVCRQWCISAKQQHLPPPLPWFILPGGTFFSLPHSASFQIPNGAEFHSSCGEWLVFSGDYTCSLVNTTTKVTLALPDLDEFDLIDEPDEVINGHSIAYTLLDQNKTISIYKLIVCSGLLVAAIVDLGDLQTLAFCRPGGDLWFVSALGCDRSLEDIIHHEGKLYTADGWRNLYVIDVEEDSESSTLIMSRTECIINGPPFPFKQLPHCLIISHEYLVESRGALLLVRGTFFADKEWESGPRVSRIEFEVFEANLQLLQWVQMTSVGMIGLCLSGQEVPSLSACLSTR
ncbi:uncharacterized protein LOC104584617 [Brachypodium distachyon]|uniref:uncharacterized protein LOC104584617 n=1 Tax=Brachypodium distachyon TaxID=15368 RepID=UPI00052FFEDE|nr:uncharacterized protein LOC104584617 [Brachypodium distachyon]|eukprot:XP_010237862.1 uncharacterized protein LOC104584617 [Brachypodium distachyon]